MKESSGNGTIAKVVVVAAPDAWHWAISSRQGRHDPGPAWRPTASAGSDGGFKPLLSSTAPGCDDGGIRPVPAILLLGASVDELLLLGAIRSSVK